MSYIKKKTITKRKTKERTCNINNNRQATERYTTTYIYIYTKNNTTKAKQILHTLHVCERNIVYVLFGTILILYYHNNLINFFVIRTICRELQQKNVFEMCFVLEDKQQKEMKLEKRRKVERYDRVLSEDQDRERSIEQVSPSLTAFRNAAKNKKKQEKEERER